MLIDLQQDLRPGDTFELTLTFQSAAERTVTVEVVEN
jgi:copper(I)-binding protein